MLYRIFSRGDGDDRPAASMRTIIIGMVVLAALATFAGVVRVTREHEVLRIGASLSKTNEMLANLREKNRELELERATLTSPERIRKLATQLGMTTVSSDRIRVIASPKVSAL